MHPSFEVIAVSDTALQRLKRTVVSIVWGAWALFTVLAVGNFLLMVVDAIPRSLFIYSVPPTATTVGKVLLLLAACYVAGRITLRSIMGGTVSLGRGE